MAVYRDVQRHGGMRVCNVGKRCDADSGKSEIANADRCDA